MPAPSSFLNGLFSQISCLIFTSARNLGFLAFKTDLENPVGVPLETSN